MPFMIVVCLQLVNVFELRFRDPLDCLHDVLREGVGAVGRGHLHGDPADSPTAIRRSLPDYCIVKTARGGQAGGVSGNGNGGGT